MRSIVDFGEINCRTEVMTVGYRIGELSELANRNYCIDEGKNVKHFTAHVFAVKHSLK